MGSDNESKQTLFDSVNWVSNNEWIDSKDGFNYKSALKKISLPNTLYLIGKNDKSLGHQIDVHRFIDESGNHKSSSWILGTDNGFLQNYDHINLLTHPDCVKDHFEKILVWIEN